MLIHLHHAADRSFWQAELDDEGVLFIVEGAIGSPGEPTRVIEDGEDPTPNERLIDVLADEMRQQGYRDAVPPLMVDVIERGHSVFLGGRVREFFARREFVKYQAKRAAKLGWTLDFASPAVRGRWSQPVPERTPIASAVDGQGRECAQCLAIDPELGDGPIFAIEGGQSREAYPSLDALLADIT